MKLFPPLVVLGLCFLQAIPVHGQLKDLPSQAEVDPILENADKKLKDFAATLNEFRVEATSLDRERFNDDPNSIKQVQGIIQVAHSGSAEGSNGVNVQRTLSIMAGLDDMAMDAGTWKELGELQMCKQALQKEDLSRQSLFVERVGMNREMLREGSNQLFHPTFRMASAADEIMLMLSTAAPKTKPK